MSDSDNMDVSLFGDGDGGCGCGGGADDYSIEYDEDGTLALAGPIGPAPPTPALLPSVMIPTAACKVDALNGSWYIQFRSQGPVAGLNAIRGPMRIEVSKPKVRISGDIYVQPPVLSPHFEPHRPITLAPIIFNRNWYPQLPPGQYSWYFRSLGVQYTNGDLVFKFERHLWNGTTQEFVSRDNGVMRLKCRQSIFSHVLLPQPTLRMTGTAQIGGETYDVTATKTSPFYRGCSVEVDAMVNRPFPLSATAANGAALTFASIYRTAGMDIKLKVDQTNLPQDAQLSNAEMQTALATNRAAAPADNAWRLWLLVGSAQGGLFGLMFDDNREGTAGFFDSTFGNDSRLKPAIRNQQLGTVAEAFLRTLVHEAGHAFNLFHPKHDVHNPPISTTIMNQTGDVIGLVAPPVLYPDNVTFAFDEHSRTSLIHSPDPQIAPGWKPFGWGHGDLSGGVASPIDAAGLMRQDPGTPDLKLSISLPDVVFRGQFVTAGFTLTNVGAGPMAVSSALNLSQGDLRLLLKTPSEELRDVRDVIVACGDRPLTTIAPGESLTGNAQLFYTNTGLTFRQIGRYVISAEFEVGDGLGTSVKSEPVTMIVRSPADPREEAIAALTMDKRVGNAFALGDFGADELSRVKLEVLAAEFSNTTTGAAAALTLSNSLSRDVRDIFTGDVLREADTDAAETHFASTAENVSSTTLVDLVTAVAAPTEPNAPVLDRASDYLGGDTGGDADAGADDGALGLLRDIRSTFAKGPEEGPAEDDGI